MPLSKTPSQAEILNAFKASIMAELRVSCPAKVVSWDASKQLADVKPLIKDIFEGEDGEVQHLSIPVITNVPVVFPGAGGMRITFPVAIGDTVHLVFCDRSIDAWLDQGGETAPVDQRRHHIADAVAYPGLHPNNAAWSGLEDGVVTLGSSTGASEFVATAQRVLTELNKIKTRFDEHTHVCPAGTTTAYTPPEYIPTLVAPASSTVKIKG